MCIYCVPLLVDSFLYSSKSDLKQSLLKDEIKYHYVETFSKSNRKIVETGKIEID